MGNGPKSWSAAKMRQKRPQSAAAKANHAQKVGKRPQKLITQPKQPLDRAILKRPKPKARPLQDNEKRLRTLDKRQGKNQVWTMVALHAPDQLRQRVAWAL